MKKFLLSSATLMFTLVIFGNSNAQVVTVAEILANPNSFQGQPLLLDGKVIEWRDDDNYNNGEEDDGIFDDNTGTINMDFQEGYTPLLQEQIFVLGFLDFDDGTWEIDVSYWWNSSNPPPVIVPDPTTIAAVLAAYPNNRGEAVLLTGQNTSQVAGENDEYVFDDNTGTIVADFQEGTPHPPLNTTYVLIGIVEDENGSAEIDVWAWDFPSSVENIGGTLPNTFELAQNYPNPFNPSTKIRFSIPVREQVIINVFNISGEIVSALVNVQLDAGNYEVSFDGSGLASGMYIYRIQTNSFVETKKMVLTK